MICFELSARRWEMRCLPFSSSRRHPSEPMRVLNVRRAAVRQAGRDLVGLEADIVPVLDLFLPTKTKRMMTTKIVMADFANERNKTLCCPTWESACLLVHI